MAENHSIAQWFNNASFSLPVSGFDQFPDFTLHQVALEGADVADVELAVEVVGFMEERAREQVFAGFFEPFSIDVLRANGDDLRPSYVFAEFRDAEAPFALGLLAFGMDDLGIREDELGFRVFFEGHVDYCKTPRNPDLRRGE